VWESLEHDDVLAAAFARLLLWTDRAPMPTTDPEGWAAYIRTWRPGKPHPAMWPKWWGEADKAVSA
jgi:hypothetical protein